MKDTCATCKFYAADKSECHRMPPVPFLIQQKDEMGLERPGAVTIFPPIDPSGWCGEYVYTLEASMAIVEAQ